MSLERTERFKFKASKYRVPPSIDNCFDIVVQLGDESPITIIWGGGLDIASGAVTGVATGTGVEVFSAPQKPSNPTKPIEIKLVKPFMINSQKLTAIRLKLIF
jgi:hypothetical protein